MNKMFLLITVFIFSNTPFLHSQNAKNPDSNNMKYSFIKTFEKDFDIVNDTIKPDKTGERFWLVTLKPKKEGLFIIGHVFEHKENWGYKYNNREYEIHVLPKGTKRFTNIQDKHFSICMGDSIVIPILIDTNIVKQSFTDTTKYIKPHIPFAVQVTKYHEQDMKEGFLKAEIQNNVPQLSCLGIKKRSVAHRSFGRSTVTYFAFFKVVKEGKFNLIVGEQSVPITILPQNGSFKTLCGSVSTYEWEDNVGSSGSNHYYLNNTTVRAGDILIVPYLSFTDYRGKERPIEKKLIINKADFSVSKDGYDDWLE